MRKPSSPHAVVMRAEQQRRKFGKVTSVKSILTHVVVFLLGAFLSSLISSLYTSHSHSRHDVIHNALKHSVVSSCTRGGASSGMIQKRTTLLDKLQKNNTQNIAITKTLVVYAGPSSKSNKLGHPELYIKNLEFFLRNGIECNRADASSHIIDTVIAVGHDFYDEYLPWVEKLNVKCQAQNPNNNNKVILISRRESCYDMEAARLTLYGGVHGIHYKDYDYFVFANCGTTGPAPPSHTQIKYQLGKGKVLLSSWTTHFTKLLTDQVKMTGLTLNCAQHDRVHIQSMVYALDRIGLQLVMDYGCIYDCLDPKYNETSFVNGYEKNMGLAIVGGGYSLRPLIRPRDGYDVNGDGKSSLMSIVNKTNLEECFHCTEEERKNATGKELEVCERKDWYSDIWIGNRYVLLFVCIC